MLVKLFSLHAWTNVFNVFTLSIQIVDNSSVYNGENDIITMNAKKVLQVVIEKLSEKEEFLMRLEKAINPLLDDNDQVWFRQ